MVVSEEKREKTRAHNQAAKAINEHKEKKEEKKKEKNLEKEKKMVS